MRASITWAAACLVAVGRGLDLSVSATDGAAVSPFFYGMMFEEINYSGDGGLYAELIENRNIKQNTTSYGSIGGATIFINNENPLSPALAQSLQITIPRNATGRVGFFNKGFDGIGVLQQDYQASFYIKSVANATFRVDLRSIEDEVFGSAEVSLTASPNWQQLNATITPSSQAPNANNTFAVTFDGAEVAGQTMYFNLVSLFPPTFKDRPNGLRRDIAEAMNEMGAKFLRFPGGNNLEGNYGLDSRWKWNQTVGPLTDRAGRIGAWTYPNTDGLGLIEYLEWTIDMGLTPILGLFAGLTLDDVNVPEYQLQPYIDDAMNELEFLLGDSDTTYGAQRSALGYPEPFDIQHVEIGNEDNLNNGYQTYSTYRYRRFADAVLAKYPNMTIISSAPGFDIPEQSQGQGWADYHLYGRPDHLVSQHHQYDVLNRSVPVLAGEVAVVQGNLPDPSGWNRSLPRLEYPNMIGACAEATYMIGAERNADLVQGITYAPLLNRIGRTQWYPDLISFTSDPRDTTRSTSYLVNQLFAHNVGSTVAPMSGPQPGPIYYSATKTDSQYFVKLANYNGTDTSVRVTIPGGGNGTASFSTVSAPDGLSYNSPRKIVTQSRTTQVTGQNDVFTVDIANLMVGVLAANVSGSGGGGVVPTTLQTVATSTVRLPK
ncbi:hypothetical protein B9Z65_110 [Elsinoe australis]|uniref:non-reducing end alpha-L-arabinofuranosidase n=1 Tax=Elsinoe australis TaxID=40998 RepID=A0A2P7ZK53_9PEZI|nr:hypothetical protein B9Z65_110 [Elsinoe australis]